MAIIRDGWFAGARELTASAQSSANGRRMDQAILTLAPASGRRGTRVPLLEKGMAGVGQKRFSRLFPRRRDRAPRRLGSARGREKAPPGSRSLAFRNATSRPGRSGPSIRVDTKNLQCIGAIPSDSTSDSGRHGRVHRTWQKANQFHHQIGGFYERETPPVAILSLLLLRSQRGLIGGIPYRHRNPDSRCRLPMRDHRAAPSPREQQYGPFN